MAEALIAGLIMKSIGDVGAGYAEADAADREAGLRDLQAKEVQFKAERDERILRKKGGEFLGSQLAKLAASGAGSIQGTPLLLLEDTLSSIEEEAMTLRHQSDFRSGQLSAGANSMRDAAASKRVGSWFSVGGNILTGISQYDKNSKGK